jgi:hypothetical protein
MLADWLPHDLPPEDREQIVNKFLGLIESGDIESFR